MSYHPQLVQALHFVETNLEEELTLESVAAAAGFSMYHFHRIFLSQIGMSVADYIRSRRLATASALLIYSEENIISIAFRCRFESQEAFTRAFKKEFGMPPGRYRKVMGTVRQRPKTREERADMKEAGTIKGWLLSGSDPAHYEMGIDRETVHMGKVSGYLKSITATSETQFATVMQQFKSDKYKGERIRLSAFVKAENVEHFAGLWMRVDNAEGDTIQFDNMSNRPINGSLPWQHYSVVLDVPADSASISFGILLTGRGKVWMDGFSFEAVDLKTPSTNMQLGADPGLRDEPENLSFEESE
ncbi:AraC family transcriptional regulator [Paenibacillus nanensis]|uniref:AraC family transcriptional regulator n=1 Tax=Paenibacillus nanensis TaxID=393251 RepID=A0A3A1VKV7_9BACL|nr:AraC family transcriptional regulator [Paenibacillus nanensis]RIX60392.1 AraC family transcriptional regulator [Paenibacillus nanensis]